jgi:hypothetical protein
VKGEGLYTLGKDIQNRDVKCNRASVLISILPRLAGGKREDHVLSCDGSLKVLVIPTASCSAASYCQLWLLGDRNVTLHDMMENINSGSYKNY